MSTRPKRRQDGKDGGLARTRRADSRGLRPAPAVVATARSAAPRSFFLQLTLACLAGVGLRLAFVTGQVLLDDEWHAMDYAIGNSLGFLLTHFSIPGATCIPINAYTWALLHTVGWNETLLRLPALVPSLASLFLLPRLVRAAFTRKTTVIFTWLLAICPFLIFYSRIARPYAMVALTGAAAVLYGYQWLASGRRAYAALYVGYGVTAVYFHLFAMVSVVAPIACGLLFTLLPSRVSFPAERIRPSYRDVSIVIAAFAGALSALLLPALIHAAGGTMSSVVGGGDMTAGSFAGFASMLAGTSSTTLLILFWCLLAVGLAFLSRTTPLLAAILVSSVVLHYLSLVITHPALIDTPLVLSRYVIAVFPLGLLLVARGIDGMTDVLESLKTGGRWGVWVRPLCALATAAFVASLFAAGPVPLVYYRPNNFTAHSAFLESFAPVNWDHSYRSDIMKDGPVIDGTAGFSRFYQRLASDSQSAAIIEYPMFIGNHFNLYYYFQHFHRKRVLVGYFPDLDLRTARSIGWVYGSSYVDYVMSREHDPGRLRMSAMVNVASLDAVRRSGASYLILHRHLPVEMFLQAAGDAEPDYAPVEYLTSLYKRELGAPLFEDAHLVVFRIDGT